MKYKAIIEENNEYVLGTNYYPAPPTSQEAYVTLEDSGRCYSPLFYVSDVSDCKKVVGLNGEIGYCYNCQYYRKNNMAYFVDDIDLYKSQIDKEFSFFVKSLEKYRKNEGLKEDVKSAYMKLEASSTQYESYHMQKLINTWEKGKE